MTKQWEKLHFVLWQLAQVHIAWHRWHSTCRQQMAMHLPETCHFGSNAIQQPSTVLCEAMSWTETTAEFSDIWNTQLFASRLVHVCFVQVQRHAEQHGCYTSG